MMKNFSFLRNIKFYTLILCTMLGLILSLVGEHHRFIAWESLNKFRVPSKGHQSLVEYKIKVPLPDFEVSELIPSWNIKLGDGELVEVCILAEFADGISHEFQLGHWGPGAQTAETGGARKSINGQKNEFGVVYTDTLVFRQTPIGLEACLRLTIRDQSREDIFDLFGVCLSGSRDLVESHSTTLNPPSNVLTVPRLCQLDYIGGEVWCSPTSVGMIMKYWSEKLSRLDFNYSVPELASQIFDPGWPGTGNWAFNVAFAGGHSGLRAFVTRLNHLNELKAIVNQGIPVATSVSYDLLKGKPAKGKNDGHLVVLVGFNQLGDPVFNDPAACPEVTRSYPIENFTKAWRTSKQTVYLIYPSQWKLPEELPIDWR